MSDPRHLLVGDVMSLDPVTVFAGAPIEDAERLMRVHAFHGLPVVDDLGRLTGVISESDLIEIRRMAVGAVIRRGPSGVRVGEVMASPAVTVPITCSLVEAARRMRDSRAHRLVAIGDDGRPVGVLSATDYVAIVADW